MQHVHAALLLAQMTQVTVPSYCFNYYKTISCYFLYVIKSFISPNPNNKKKRKFKLE